MDDSAAFGGIKSLSPDRTREKGLSREKQSPKKKFRKGGGRMKPALNLLIPQKHII